MSPSPYVALLATLTLFESFVMPCGVIRRSSLLGYMIVASGDVLDLTEAAERIAAWRPEPRPGLVRLAEPAPRQDAGELAELKISNPEIRGADAADGVAPGLDGNCETAEEAAPEGAQAAPMPCSNVTCMVDGRPCPECAPAFYAERDRATFGEEVDEYCDGNPIRARVVACPSCAPARRQRRRSCWYCEGRRVRLWVNSTEIKHHAPKEDSHRVAAGFALADGLRDFDEAQIKGAKALLGVILRDAPKEVRRRVLAQWQFAVDLMAREAAS